MVFIGTLLWLVRNSKFQSWLLYLHMKPFPCGSRDTVQAHDVPAGKSRADRVRFSTKLDAGGAPLCVRLPDQRTMGSNLPRPEECSTFLNGDLEINPKTKLLDFG